MSEATATFGSGSPGDALIWGAYVDDHTIEFFARFDRNVDQMASGAQRTASKVDVGSKKSAAGVGILAGAVAGVTAKLAAMGLQALAQFKQLVTSSIQLAARADTLAISLGVVGSNAGYTAEQMADFEEKMKANGITTIATRQALLQMSQAQLDLAQSADLSRVAQDAAVIAGTNSSEAFSRMIHGITTLNPRVLRHLGIIVNMEAEYKKFATAAGMAAQELDYNAKQQIMMNAVLEAGTRIAGTYEAAMGTAGKQAGSLARYQEELQLAMGKTFQPAYLAWIQFQTENLKKLQEWFEENSEAVENFGATFGYIVKSLLTGLSTLIGWITKIPKAIKELSPAIKFLEMLIPDLDERWKNLGVTFRQTIVLVSTLVAMISTGFKGLVNIFQQAAPLIQKAIKMMFTPFWERGPEFRQELQETSMALLELGRSWGDVSKEAFEAGRQAAYETSVALNLIEPAADAAVRGTTKVADAMELLKQEIEASIPVIEELNQKFAEELEKIAVQRARDEIEVEIRRQRRVEDIERGHQKRIEDIVRDAAKRKKEILEDATEEEQTLIEKQADERLELERSYRQEIVDIETDYRRTLENISADFDFQASEIARRNDAVALASLIRQTARRIDEAKQARDENRSDAQINYVKEQKDLKKHQEEQRAEIRKDLQERMDEYKQDLQERLEEANRQREEDYEDLHRSLEREREDRLRQYQYADEDRIKAHEKELQGLGAHFSEMEHLTEEHIAYLLATYGESIDSLDAMWDEYYSRREAAASEAGAYTRPGIPRSAAETSGISEEDLERLDPYTRSWMGLATGGIGIATRPQTVMVGEQEPEMFGAIPLSRLTQHDFNFNFSDWNINGVSPDMEADMKPVMMGMLRDLARGLREGRSR